MDPRLARKAAPEVSAAVTTVNKDEENGWNAESTQLSTQSSTMTTTSESMTIESVVDTQTDANIATESADNLESETVEKTVNGVDKKVWNDIFNIEKVSDCGKLQIDVTGMTAQTTSLRQPLKIGEYSLKIDVRTDRRLFIPDASELKYLHVPPVISAMNLDLNHGYLKDIIWGKPSDTKLDELLQWILINRKKFMIGGELTPKELHTDFVTYRGVLAKVMVSPYENSERWMICATKYRGTIYLCQFHENYPMPDDYYNRMCFSGFRFENYLSSYYEDIPPDPNDFDLDHHEYCCVVRSRLNSERTSHSLAFGAELDCVIPKVKEQPGTLNNFVELKTTKQMNNEKQYRSFLKYKLVKWWAQSYLVGVPLIYCGYKNNQMFVQEVEPLHIEQFPNLCSEFWSPNVCLNFLNRFLSFVKECVTIDDPNVVYQFIFQPNQDISCKRLLEPGDEFQILPEWYIKEF